MRPRELDFISEGLAAMAATDFLDVFTDFRAVMSADRALSRRVIEGGGFGDIPKVIKDLDRRFFALAGTDRLITQNASWLKSLPELTPLSLGDLQLRKSQIVASNRLLNRRIAITTERRRRSG